MLQDTLPNLTRKCFPLRACFAPAAACPGYPTLVVKLLDVLTYRGHYCLVTELFDGTLSFQEFGGNAGRPDDGKAASPAPAMALDYARRGTGPARGSALGLYDQGMRDDRGGGLQRRGIPAEPGSRLGPAAWGGDGVGGGCGGASGSSSSFCGRSDTGSGESGSAARSASPGSSPSPPPGEGCPAHVIRHVALQLVSALLLLRNHGLIHADIKPENFLLKVEEGRTGVEAAGKRRSARRVGLWDLVRGRTRMGGVESLTVRLGDLGNAIHKSEAYLYYGDFEIQTLAYRAPEVSVPARRNADSGFVSLGFLFEATCIPPRTACELPGCFTRRTRYCHISTRNSLANWGGTSLTCAFFSFLIVRNRSRIHVVARSRANPTLPRPPSSDTITKRCSWDARSDRRLIPGAWV